MGRSCRRDRPLRGARVCRQPHDCKNRRGRISGSLCSADAQLRRGAVASGLSRIWWKRWCSALPSSRTGYDQCARVHSEPSPSGRLDRFGLFELSRAPVWRPCSFTQWSKTWDYPKGLVHQRETLLLAPSMLAGFGPDSRSARTGHGHRHSRQTRRRATRTPWL